MINIEEERKAFEIEWIKLGGDFKSFSIIDNMYVLIPSMASADDVIKEFAERAVNSAFALWLIQSRQKQVVIDDLNIQLKDAKATPEWILISERMPKEGEEVFVHHFGHVVQATKDEKYLGGFKQRNCYGWEAVSSYISHWIPTNVELPQSFNFYYENDAKQKAMIEAQELSHD